MVLFSVMAVLSTPSPVVPGWLDGDSPLRRMAAAAAVLLGTGALPRWMGLGRGGVGLVVGVRAVGLVAGLDIGPADQAVLLLVAAWVAVLAYCLGCRCPLRPGGR